MTSLAAWAAFLCVPAAFVTLGIARDLAGVHIPETVSASGKELRLNGVGIGKKSIFKVYVIALYLEHATSDPRTALHSNEVKRIVLTMLRDVSRETFVQTVEKDMLRDPGVPAAVLRERLNHLESALPTLKAGNTLDFTYQPARGTIVRGQGREITIKGKDFADALFSVWLSPKSSSPALRKDLVSGGG